MELGICISTRTLLVRTTTNIDEFFAREMNSYVELFGFWLLSLVGVNYKDNFSRWSSVAIVNIFLNDMHNIIQWLVKVYLLLEVG